VARSATTESVSTESVWWVRRSQQQQQQQQQPVEEADAAAGKADELPPLPEGWSEHIDPSSGQPYYYNANDGTTTWDRPVVEVEEEVKAEVVELSEEVVVAEETKEPEDTEKAQDSHGDSAGSFYSSGSPEDSQRAAMPGYQQDGAQGAREEPAWGMNQTEVPRQEQPQQGWGMPQQQDQRPAWGVRPDNMNKMEQEDRSGMAQQPSMHQDQYRGQDQQQLPGGRGPLQKPMQQHDPAQGKEPDQQFPSQQQPRDWQREAPKQQQEESPSQTTEPQKAFPSAAGSQSVFTQAQAEAQRPPQQPQQEQAMQQQGQHMQQQRPPMHQQRPPEQMQRGIPQQHSSAYRQQAPPQQQQQRPIQPGQPQRQLPPWQQQQGQPQQQQPQYQQGMPPQGQQGAYGQYNPQGQGYASQYGQYGSPPPGYGQQAPPENQVVVQNEGNVVKEALGSAWKGILGFGSRTKEVAAQAKDRVVEKATAAGQTIGTTSQGKRLCIPLRNYFDLHFCNLFG
jgi:hypothetical protein